MSVIDMHAHYVSPELIREAERNGARYGVRLARDGETERLVVAGRALRPFFPELCDLGLRVPVLDTQGVDRQIISTWTDLAGEELPAPEGARWARLQNETLAAAAKSMPDRFEAMGTLPLQDVRLALDELDHMVGLGIRSVEMGTNVNGRDLDDPELWPLWRRLCELEIFVFLHPPVVPVGMERVGQYFLNNLVSYPVDTTIAAARLIFSGIMRDLPALKVCLAHGGGFLPYEIGRFDRGFAAHPACRAVLAEAPSRYLRAFYYDTLTHDSVTLKFLAEAVGADRLVYGSDQPFEMLDPTGPDRVRALAALTADEVDDVLGGNVAAALG
jgi:aminocarboxymuconate-semialdehyde decarboxylase